MIEPILSIIALPFCGLICWVAILMLEKEKNKMSKKYTVILHDITFEKIDEDGQPLMDDEGNIIVYEAPCCDYSWVAEAFNDHDDEELERMLVPVKEVQNA